MPRNPQSLRLTNRYRQALLIIGRRAELQAQELWPSIERLDETQWPDQMAHRLSALQREAVRLTAGYMTAFLRLERGSGTAVGIDPRAYAGIADSGRPLADLLESPVIGVLAALKGGKTPAQALSHGLNRALRIVGFEAVQAGRRALIDTVGKDQRFSDFRRSVAGTCAACLSLSGSGGPRFEVHPNCQCVPMPVVSGVPERIKLPTGIALFLAMARKKQDEAIGPEAAALVRSGKAQLSDFVRHIHQKEGDDFITQAPVKDA